MIGLCVYLNVVLTITTSDSATVILVNTSVVSWKVSEATCKLRVSCRLSLDYSPKLQIKRLTVQYICMQSVSWPEH